MSGQLESCGRVRGSAAVRILKLSALLAILLAGLSGPVGAAEGSWRPTISLPSQKAAANTADLTVSSNAEPSASAAKSPDLLQQSARQLAPARLQPAANPERPSPDSNLAPLIVAQRQVGSGLVPPPARAGAPADPPADQAIPAPVPASLGASPEAAGTSGRAELPSTPPSKIAQQYCINIADAAADARFAWQKKTLAEIEQELDKRIAMLEERTAEYQKWLAQREEFVRKARENLVGIYSRMRPDAAASQLVAMEEETAAAVLTKLDPRNASAILNEMNPAQAARLTAIIAGAAKVPAEGGVADGPSGKKS